jgi:arylsulfatase A
MRRRGLRIADAALVFVALAPTWVRGQADRAPAAERPNIVVILADDVGWGDVGFNGRTTWRTPNLDRLASQGTVLRRFYAGAVTCAPSRAVLLTGRHTIHNRVTRNDDDLPAEEVTIAEALKPLGYRTALFGKWHHGRPRVEGGDYVHPIDQGFDEFFGFTDAQHAWEKFPEKLWEDRSMVASSGYADDLFAARAAKFLAQRGRDRMPFLLYLPLTSGHFDIEAPEDEVARHRGRFPEKDPELPLNATYAAMITRFDAHVGQVIEALDHAGLSENTLVIVTSDHGATFELGNQGTCNAHDSNAPFRGQKRTLWEGGIRVPAVVRWPGQVAAGAVTDEPMHMADLFPTLLGVIGVEPEPAWTLDGVDLLPAWRGRGPVPERTLFWEWRSEGSEQVAAMRGRHKLVISRGGKPELYDVVADPAERRDIAAECPEEVARLRAELEDWLATEAKP